MRDRGDAGESGRQQPQVRQRDLAPERPQPGVQVRDLGVGQHLGELADEPLGRHPQELVGALLAGPRPDDLIERRVLLEHLDELGDALVRVRHVGVGPHHDLAAGLLGADAADGARAAVAVEVHDLQMREAGRGLVQAGERLVGGRVIVGQELVGVAAGIHGRADPRHLGRDVVLLVVAGQDDRDVRAVCGWTERSQRAEATTVCAVCSGSAVERGGHGVGSDIQTLTVSGTVCSGRGREGVLVLGAAQRS